MKKRPTNIPVKKSAIIILNTFRAVPFKYKVKLSNIIKRHTGFPLYGPDTSPACGSWADEVEVLYKRPSATIELGSKNPVPIAEFNGLYKKNLWIWADIALAVMNSQF